MIFHERMRPDAMNLKTFNSQLSTLNAQLSTRSALGGRVALAALCGVLALTSCSRSTPSQEDDFIRLMNTGKNYLDQNQADKAIPLFTRAVALAPSRTDAHLNLANALLLAGQAEDALRHAQIALSYDRNSAAAYYVAGCAHLRLGQFEEAVQMFQPSRDLDPTIASVSYQLGRAHQELGHFEDASVAYQEAVSLDPNHPVAHYALSQALVRTGRPDEAQTALEKHQAVLARGTGAPASPEAYERCAHTQARAPAEVVKPDPQGVPVRFVDATAAAFGPDAAKYQGPLAVLDYNHDNRNSLIAAEGTNGFRLLDNVQGVFRPRGDPLPANPAGRFRQILVGDLNNDRFEDLIVLGETASHAYRFATNGAAREVTAASGLKGLVGSAGALVDLDFTGKLDLLTALPGGNGLRVLRNLGNMYFKDITATSGVPATVTGARQLLVDDWNNDDMMDLFVALDAPPPLYLQKQRGGPLVPTKLPTRSRRGTRPRAGRRQRRLARRSPGRRARSPRCVVRRARPGRASAAGPARLEHPSLARLRQRRLARSRRRRRRPPDLAQSGGRQVRGPDR